MMKEITVEQLKNKIDLKKSFTLLDVRDLFEIHIANINTDSVQIPLEELKQRFQELDNRAETIVMCRSGSRSALACQLLEKEGFSNVCNLKGGINEWSRKIDTSQPVY